MYRGHLQKEGKTMLLSLLVHLMVYSQFTGSSESVSLSFFGSSFVPGDRSAEWYKMQLRT